MKKALFYHLSHIFSSFDPWPLCFQDLTVAVETCSAASTGTPTSTTVPMTTRPRPLPRSVKRTPWWWLTRSREYRFFTKWEQWRHRRQHLLKKTGVWVWTFWNEHWHEWLSENWKDLIYKNYNLKKIMGKKRRKKEKVLSEGDAWMITFFFFD